MRLFQGEDALRTERHLVEFNEVVRDLLFRRCPPSLAGSPGFQSRGPRCCRRIRQAWRFTYGDSGVEVAEQRSKRVQVEIRVQGVLNAVHVESDNPVNRYGATDRLGEPLSPAVAVGEVRDPSVLRLKFGL